MSMTPKFALIAVVAGSVSGMSPPSKLDQPAYDSPAQRWNDVEAPSREVECRDRIQRARAAAGQLRIERAPADADKPILHYAIDRRIDGCGVLVPVGDPAGTLPLPKSGPPVMLPAGPKG